MRKAVDPTRNIAGVELPSREVIARWRAKAVELEPRGFLLAKPVIELADSVELLASQLLGLSQRNTHLEDINRRLKKQNKKERETEKVEKG